MQLDKKFRAVCLTSKYRKEVGAALTPHLATIPEETIQHFTQSITSYVEERAHCAIFIDRDLRGVRTYKFAVFAPDGIEKPVIYFQIDIDEDTGEEFAKLVSYKIN